MPNYAGSLDRVFQALTDPTRRDILARLVRGPASVSELARPIAMSLPAVMQHLQVLQDSGLVRSEKPGRVRTCRIGLGEQRTVWEHRLDQLGDLLAEHPDPPGSTS